MWVVEGKMMEMKEGNRKQRRKANGKEQKEGTQEAMMKKGGGNTCTCNDEKRQDYTDGGREGGSQVVTSTSEI
ncbi:hypothetical protein Hamer_G007423 [Homarus americanus]|uniref:Uncharacterized protein n=1 Tax=Homarus americanus TaxID=6706 RepID=A0A8J5JTG8_HOMAM|nr:hypothetical protein Hamer_G007423 [Homarus americanus]